LELPLPVAAYMADSATSPASDLGERRMANRRRLRTLLPRLVRPWVSMVALMATAASACAQSAPPRRDSVRVPILVYHHIEGHRSGETALARELDVSSAVFAAQMRYLVDQGFHVIGLDALVDALQRGTPVADHSVVITFDDGWMTQYLYALPILKQLGLTATFFVITAQAGVDPGYMNWQQLKELQSAGMTIEAHSRTHPKLTEPSVSLTSEVAGSRQDIQQHLGTTSDVFAYPYGEYDAQTVAAVRAAGFRAARALSGISNTSSDLYALHAVLATDDMAAFERAVAGR
jgi:peptidoglycan/xylan/chitin deacetylase (PgdA/CDA1 family)